MPPRAAPFSRLLVDIFHIIWLWRCLLTEEEREEFMPCQIDVCMEWRCRNVDEKWKWKPVDSHTLVRAVLPYNFHTKRKYKARWGGRWREGAMMFCVYGISTCCEAFSQDKIMTLYITFLVNWSLSDFNKLSGAFMSFDRILDDIYTLLTMMSVPDSTTQSCSFVYKWTRRKVYG